MARIFISYRRRQAAFATSSLLALLQAHYGEDDIFFDKNTIDPGADFKQVIEDNLAKAKVMLVLMSPEWMTCALPNGRRRLDCEDDFVRLEVATALERKITVIQVLLEGATVPRSDDLPVPLRRLPSLNALELNEAMLDVQFKRLLDILKRQVPPGIDPKPAPKPEPVESNTTLINRRLKEARLILAEADDHFGSDDRQQRTARLNNAFKLLKEANERDPANTEVLLEMAKLLQELTPDDTSDELRLLKRVKTLLAHPKTDSQRLDLAQAIFLTAISSKPVDAESVEDAMAVFQSLGATDWVRQCRQALRAAKPEPPKPAPSPTPAPQPPPAIPQPQPFNPPQPPPQPAPIGAMFPIQNPMQLVGRWRAQFYGIVETTMFLELRADGTCDGRQTMPFVGEIPFNGRWNFEPYSQTLQMWVTIMFQQTGYAMGFQGSTGPVYRGMDANGVAFAMERSA